jgi:hypothetical protein
VPDQSGRATHGRAVADLMGLGFDMIRGLSENTAGRSGCGLDGICSAWIKGKPQVGIAAFYALLGVGKPSEE